MALRRKTPLRPKKKTASKGLDTDVINRLLGEGKLQKGSTFKAKPKPMRKRAQKNGPTQMDVFRQIWAERPHVSEVGGEFLGEEMQPIFMSHLLPKGSYRKYKLDKRNIVLMTAEEHIVWGDIGPRHLQHMDKWKLVCEKYYQLRDESNGISQSYVPSQSYDHTS